ncbi:MAG: hypothetical protein HZB51_10770 [Chloroflexi bacterium]|nr:hypothetical protein [Chloroflexota bacterium]
MKSNTIIHLLWAALLLLSACATTTPMPVQIITEGFAIYLPAQKFTATEILNAPLDSLQLENKPVLSLDDIAAYSQETHTIALTPSGYEKIKQFKVPTSGIPFVVCVAHQPIYVDAFWASYSSQSFNGAVIDTLLVERDHSVRIQLGYPESPERFVGGDRRADPRIIQALQQAGKLKNALPTTQTETPPPTLLIPTATDALNATTNTSWKTYVFKQKVTVDYPSGWSVVPLTDDSVDFRSPDRHSYVRLELYSRPLKDSALANPHSWENNQGGYKIHWEKPIAMDSAEGFEFIWGVRHNDQWDDLPFLMAVYYSQRDELDVRLTTSVDAQGARMMQTLGFEQAIAARFSIFEQMVSSVRINHSTTNPPSSPKRIAFPPGGTSATLQGSLAPNGMDNYILRALAGQTMTVNVLTSKVPLLLQITGVDGNPLKTFGAGSSNWSGILPTTQDYVIGIIAENASAATYALQITIPPLATPTPGNSPPKRIAFPPGGTSATLEGNLVPNGIDSFILRALAGQTMTVNAFSKQANLLLEISGADGNPLKTFGAGSSNWSGVLPRTEDYVIKIATENSGAAIYTLLVTIPPIAPSTDSQPKRIQFAQGATSAT